MYTSFNVKKIVKIFFLNFKAKLIYVSNNLSDKYETYLILGNVATIKVRFKIDKKKKHYMKYLYFFKFGPVI